MDGKFSFSWVELVGRMQNSQVEFVELVILWVTLERLKCQTLVFVTLGERTLAKQTTFLLSGVMPECTEWCKEPAWIRNSQARPQLKNNSIQFGRNFACFNRLDFQKGDKQRGNDLLIFLNGVCGLLSFMVYSGGNSPFLASHSHQSVSRHSEPVWCHCNL